MPISPQRTVRTWASIRFGFSRACASAPGWSERELEASRRSRTSGRLDLGDEPPGLLYAVNHEYADRDHAARRRRRGRADPAGLGRSFPAHRGADRTAAAVAEVPTPRRVRSRPSSARRASSSRGRTVHYLDYEAYGGMAEKVMAELAEGLRRGTTSARSRSRTGSVGSRSARSRSRSPSPPRTAPPRSPPARRRSTRSRRPCRSGRRRSTRAARSGSGADREPGRGPGRGRVPAGRQRAASNQSTHPGVVREPDRGGRAEDRASASSSSSTSRCSWRVRAGGVRKDAGGEPRLELWDGERPLAAAPPR